MKNATIQYHRRRRIRRQRNSGAIEFVTPMILSLIVFCAYGQVGGCTGTPGETPTPTPTATASPSPTPTADPSPAPSPSPTAQPAVTELSPDGQRRVAIQSDCGQNVLACAGVMPIPDIDIAPGPDQFLTFGEGAVVITGKSETGVELVHLIGSNSIPGSGADSLSHSWSYGATDANRDTLTPGIEFSRASDVLVGMAVGFHYIRLIVRNGDEPAAENWSPNDNQTNFIELAIEIRFSDSPFLAKPN